MRGEQLTSTSRFLHARYAQDAAAASRSTLCGLDISLKERGCHSEDAARNPEVQIQTLTSRNRQSP